VAPPLTDRATRYKINAYSSYIKREGSSVHLQQEELPELNGAYGSAGRWNGDYG
jgi:hypothetical protein